ncbi:Uncharacterised protein [[Clostridium] sordellii]|uniref:hypothetical protein n=1 Tax=Paraclostridium sordellii TaxID=1505 RepID=UPI0005E183B9|nr:hypothetical protein [Paeniclostridium sordellii]CEQ01659.1 Uncharacterised protein [[Clostridium] sordellii] [Paeniclostridium sordellii]
MDRIKEINGQKMISVLLAEEELSFVIDKKQQEGCSCIGKGKNFDRLLKKCLKYRTILRQNK